MIHLGTIVLSSSGAGMAPVGAFLHPPDRPRWDHTMTYDGLPAEIVGSTVVDAEDLRREALCLVVTGREKAPLIADEQCRVYSMDRGEWVAISNLRDFESLRVPEISPLGLISTWSKVKRVIKAPLPDRVWMDTHKMWGQVKLVRGRWSWASPACFIHI